MYILYQLKYKQKQVTIFRNLELQDKTYEIILKLQDMPSLIRGLFLYYILLVIYIPFYLPQ